MDIEARLRQLESHYRAALSATVAAKASYLALAGASHVACQPAKDLPQAAAPVFSWSPASLQSTNK
jgi:hypothetical protein